METVYFEGEGGVPLIRNGEVVKRPAEPSELARQYTNEAIDFIEQNRDEPFFLYLPHTTLHRPLGVSERFKGGSDSGLYGDAIQEMDHHVGRLIGALERLGLDERTLVVYASENGRGPGRTSEKPIRGHKLTTYNLENDPGERNPVNNRKIHRKLRGMAIMFQEEMRRHARPAGEVAPATGAAKPTQR